MPYYVQTHIFKTCVVSSEKTSGMVSSTIAQCLWLVFWVNPDELQWSQMGWLSGQHREVLWIRTFFLCNIKTRCNKAPKYLGCFLMFPVEFSSLYPSLFRWHRGIAYAQRRGITRYGTFFRWFLSLLTSFGGLFTWSRIYNMYKCGTILDRIICIICILEL